MPAPTPLAVTFVLALALGLPAHAQTAAAIADGLGQRGTPADPSAPAAATPTSDSATDEVVAAFIGDYVAQAVERGQIPGAALVVVRRGRVILGRGYGVADYDDGRPVLIDETLFHQASISKTFIWLLVLHLVGQGRLDLDRDVNEYLDFAIPAAFGEPITMRHLMTHTSGFADRVWGLTPPDEVIASLGQVLRDNVPDRLYRPGTTVAYSNYGAALAAHIVERIEELPFETLVTERIFSPVGMARSTFSAPPPATLAASLATSYGPGSREPVPFPVLAIPPAGSLSATPADMGRYLAMLLRGGETDGGVRIVEPDALAQAMTLQQPLGPGLVCGWGLGFGVFGHRGVGYAGHGGDYVSIVTDLVLLPDHDLGWSLSLNGRGTGDTAMRLRYDLARAVIERFFAPEAGAPEGLGPSTASEVAGSYRSTIRVAHGPVRLAEPPSLVDVTADESGAITVSDARRPDGTLERWFPAGADRFVVPESGAQLTAIRDERGGAIGFASCDVPPYAPIMQYERASLLTSASRWLFPLALVVLVAGALAPPAGWLLRRIRRVPRRDAAPDRRRIVRRLSRVSMWLLLGTVLGWMVTFVLVSQNHRLLFTLRAPMILLGILSICSALFAGTIVVDAALAWLDRRRRWPQRLGLPLVAAAAIVLVVLFFGFDLTSLSTDY